MILYSYDHLKIIMLGEYKRESISYMQFFLTDYIASELGDITTFLFEGNDKRPIFYKKGDVMFSIEALKVVSEFVAPFDLYVIKQNSYINLKNINSSFLLSVYSKKPLSINEFMLYNDYYNYTNS